MKGEAVVVTGAGSGIGRAVALLCAEQGANIAAMDVDAGRADDVVVEAMHRGAPAAVALVGDVGSEAAVGDAFGRCISELGNPRRVFANAGIEINAPAHDMTLDVWQRVLNVNLTGTFLTCKHALRAMLADGRGGSIVCTSSPSAFVGFAGGRNGAYGASKGGISALVRSLALDYAAAGIRVNAVVPGATDTPLLTQDVPTDQLSHFRQQVAEQAREEIPVQRLAEPAEIAAGVVWLLSDAAVYVTGSHLFIDGGLTAKSANTI